MLIKKLKQLLNQREDGFTLIELMIVVLIIGILAAIAIPVFLNLQKEGAKAEVKSGVKNASTLAQTALTTAGLGELGTAADGSITVNGVATANKVATKDGLTITVAADTTTAEAGDYIVTGSSAQVDDYSYAFTSRTGLYTEATVAAPQAPVIDTTDSDGDGFSDSDELADGTDPNNPDDYLGAPPVVDPNADSDGDGYTDAQEAEAGTSPTNASDFPGSTPEADPTITDTDGDWLMDADELNGNGRGWFTDPNVADSDGDGFHDGEEVFAADPTDPTDPARYPGGPSGDTDGDRFSDAVEATYGTDPNNPNDFPVLNDDSDGDGWSDGDELAWGTDMNDAGSYPQV